MRANRVVQCAGTAVLAMLLLCGKGSAQLATWQNGKPVVPAAEAAKDPLGRTTPRGTVIGFLIAARKGENEVAAQYLNTRQKPAAAAALAAELFVVLDRRLPARLNELSDRPEGPPTDPLNPGQYLVGTIRDTNLGVFLERVERKDAPPIWLFSTATLASIPELYEQINVAPVEATLPKFLVNRKVAGVALYEWLAVLVGLPLAYLLAGVLNRLLGVPAGWVLRHWRRRNPGLPNPRLLPYPIRLLLLAALIRFLLSRVGLSLLARQFWVNATAVITIVACAWLLILLNRRSERYIRDHLQTRNLFGAASLQRLVRRGIDLIVGLAGVFVILRHFGVDITPALAGLGVGGIAIALAAQKTLENVIGGVSLIADQAVRVGDFLKLGDVSGTVTDIGLRSIRIRTLDRTIVNIPNGQIANMSVEVISARDGFWFHPMIALRQETTAAQILAVTEGARRLLTGRPDVAMERVRLFRLGTLSIDIDVSAYVAARDWNHFLEIQEELLHAFMEIVQNAGCQFASPLQNLYFIADSARREMFAGPASEEGLSKAKGVGTAVR